MRTHTQFRITPARIVFRGSNHPWKDLSSKPRKLEQSFHPHSFSPLTVSIALLSTFELGVPKSFITTFLSLHYLLVSAFQSLIDECKLKWTEAKTAFEKFKPSASKVAEEMRRSMSKNIAEKNRTDHEVEFKKLSRHAKQRETGMKIRRVNKKLKKGFVHKFVLTDPLMGAVTAVEDKQGMEALSKETNTLRWTACKISKFMHTPVLLKDIGVCCKGPEIEAVLNGTYEPSEHLSEPTKRVLRSLAQPELIRNNPMPTVEMTLESHQWAWQHVKEATASAPQTLTSPTTLQPRLRPPVPI